MLIKCDICGYEFDYEDADLSECACTCGLPRPKCPECGLDILLPPEFEQEQVNKQEEDSIFAKMENELKK